jgi:hypothetical protein
MRTDPSESPHDSICLSVPLDPTFALRSGSGIEWLAACRLHAAIPAPNGTSFRSYNLKPKNDDMKTSCVCNNVVH